MQLNTLTIEQASEGLRNSEFTSVELTQACLRAIQDRDSRVRAFLTVTEDRAIAAATAADAMIGRSEQTPLSGIPLAVKDVIVTDGVRSTGGSKILDTYVGTYDATVIRRLQSAGAVVLGKTNLDEFAMGSSTENSAFQKTSNPWDLSRVPGGSSGGSAAAVSADLCTASLGTDTGGSIRQPASFCGVVGLKPTYGRVSRYGLMAMTSSLDQIGPFTKTVRDAALLFNAIAGVDPNDVTTVSQPPLNVGNLQRDIRGMTLGVPDEYFIEGMDPDVQAAVEAAVKQYEELGVKVVRLSLPLTKYALSVYYLTVTSEVSANLARYDGIRYGLSAPGAKNLAAVYAQSRAAGFGSEVKRRTILGTFTLSAGYYDRYYVKAQQVRELIRREFAQAFKRVDCLVTPTSPSVAFKLAEKFEDPLLMYLSDIYTVPANIGGICAVSVPCGFSHGLPIGLQVMSRPFGEELALRLAYHYEQATEWHTRRPPVR